MDTKYDVYVEVFRITEWCNDSVYKTISLGCNWFDESIVKANNPRESNLLYVAANDEYAQTHMTIKILRTS